MSLPKCPKCHRPPLDFDIGRKVWRCLYLTDCAYVSGPSSEETPPHSTLVVNLFGGPGTGKSTTAAHLFALLKYEGIVTELAMEWPKEQIWAGAPLPLDQIEVFTEQRRRLRRIVGQVQVAVTDCPLPHVLLYDEWDHHHSTESDFSRLVWQEYHRYWNLNVLIHRRKDYSPVGRHVDADDARQIDALLHQHLTSTWQLGFTPVDGTPYAAPRILAWVLEALK